VPPNQWQGFELSDLNVASQRQMGGFILGLTLPAFFIIAIAVGCFHPAIDTIAGERERGTWETLMSTAAHRPSLAAAKFLYVATFGGLAGLLNLAALALTLRPVLAPLLADGAETIHFSLPLGAWPVAALAALLMAAFVAAGMLAFALFARTFTEGQSLLTPFFLLLVVPTLFLQTPGLTFSPTLACVPVVNIGLMLRTAFAGSYPPLPIALTTLVTLSLVLLILRAGATRLSSLDILDHTRPSTGLRSWFSTFRHHPSSPTPPRPSP
jgi:sodium transport system permease protein